MKTILKIFLTSLIFLHAPLLCADDIKVMVGFFESKDSEKGLARKMSIACAEEVMRSKGFTYMTPTEFAKIITGNNDIMVDKEVDIIKEYSDKNIEYLQAASKSHKNTLDDFFKTLESLDIMMGGSVSRDGALVKAELTMVNGKNQRHYVAKIESREDSLDAELRQKVRHFLKKMAAPVKVYADRLIDDKESRVLYLVKAKDGTDIKVEMDYTGDRPDPETRVVSILPPENVKKDNAAEYSVIAEEGKSIDIEFAFKNGKLDYVHVDTPMPNPANKGEQSETLTMKTSAGYKLKFEFAWDKGEMKYAKLYPELNPFGDYEE